MILEDVGVEATLSVDGSPFDVLSYELTERLSDLSQLTCRIVKHDTAPPEPSELIDKPCELTLKRTDGSQQRSFVGLVVRAERLPAGDDVPSVALLVMPKLWQLSKRTDCRTFQHVSVPDIVKKVLEGAGVPQDHQQWKLTGSYSPRDYVVQYRETDLAFVLRLLSEEGIFFAVHPIDGKDTVVLTDDPTGLGLIEGTSTLGYLQRIGPQSSTDNVYHVEQHHLVCSDKVTLRDYDWKKPKLTLESKAEGSDPGSHALEHYLYPGRYVESADGDRYAQILLDSIQAGRNLITGETGVLGMRPGLRFSIEQHPYAPLNQELLITQVTIRGRQQRQFAIAGAGERPNDYAYGCHFVGIPTKTSKYRPPRPPAERLIPELQTALSTGPSGQEIHTNEHGQITAQFHWDRLGKKDEKSSCWMRTSQLPFGGSMLLPRMKWEVAVRHVEGDADRPMVFGRLYNGINPPPYELPANKGRSALQTATTPGGGSSNEFRMSDAKGSEQMFFNGSKDASVDVKNNTTESVGANQTRSIGSNQKLNVTNSITTSIGANQNITVGANQNVHVETFFVEQIGGDHTLSIGGNRDMKVGGDHKREVSANSSLSVSGMQVDLVVGSITDKTLASFTHNVGAALIEMTAANRSITIGASRTENTGAAKIIAVKGGRGVEVGGTMTTKVGGAIINAIKGDRTESCDGTYTETAAGAQIIKANNITIEAETVLTLVMGASVINMLPAMITIAGVSVKMDGPVTDTAALIVDN